LRYLLHKTETNGSSIQNCGHNFQRRNGLHEGVTQR